ncbi:MAG: hypothetical protein IJ168_02100 [Eubacterium sp.]|nr:hypothetical protein [Eubacterium sp.]
MNMSIIVAKSFAEWGIDILSAALEWWNDKFKTAFDVLTTSPDVKFPNTWASITSVNGYIAAISVPVAVIFFYIGLTRTAIHFEDLRRPERFFGIFIRLIVSVFLVTKCQSLLFNIMKIFQAAMIKIMALPGISISADTGLQEGVPNEIVTMARSASLIADGGILVAYLCMLLGALIFVLSLVLVLTIYLRIFRIYIYIAISPFPLASYGGESTSRIGRTFILNYLAVCLQGIVIVIAFIIYANYIQNDVTIDPNNIFKSLMLYVGQVALGQLVLISTIRASDRMTKEMIGG